jgi:hypothetical protein
MLVTLRIFRYNPEKDKRGHYETYELEADENGECWTTGDGEGHHDGSLRSALPAYGCAARTPCASTGATTSPARRW